MRLLSVSVVASWVRVLGFAEGTRMFWSTECRACRTESKQFDAAFKATAAAKQHATSGRHRRNVRLVAR